MSIIKFRKLLDMRKISSFKYESFRIDTRTSDKGETDKIIVFILADADDATPSLNELMSSTFITGDDNIPVHYKPLNRVEIHCSFDDLDKAKDGDFLTEVKYIKAFGSHKVGDVVMGIDDSLPEADVDSTIELTGKGSYAGDLWLDVSKSNKAYLTSIKFIDASRRMRKEYSNSRRAEDLLRNANNK